jgi:Acyl-CoA carboxylase epsilon subunit
MTTPPGQALYISFVHGQPSREQVASVVAIFAAKEAVAAPSVPAPAAAGRSEWLNRRRLMRQPMAPGPGAWRRSGLLAR